MTHKRCPRCGYETAGTNDDVVAAVLTEVAEDHNLTVEEIVRHSRDDGNGLVWAARLCAYERLRWDMQLSLKQLERVFSRDHSTLIHWGKKLTELRSGKRSGWLQPFAHEKMVVLVSPYTDVINKSVPLTGTSTERKTLR